MGRKGGSTTPLRPPAPSHLSRQRAAGNGTPVNGARLARQAMCWAWLAGTLVDGQARHEPAGGLDRFTRRGVRSGRRRTPSPLLAGTGGGLDPPPASLAALLGSERQRTRRLRFGVTHAHHPEETVRGNHPSNEATRLGGRRRREPVTKFREQWFATRGCDDRGGSVCPWVMGSGEAGARLAAWASPSRPVASRWRLFCCSEKPRPFAHDSQAPVCWK